MLLFLEGKCSKEGNQVFKRKGLDELVEDASCNERQRMALERGSKKAI